MCLSMATKMLVACYVLLQIKCFLLQLNFLKSKRAVEKENYIDQKLKLNEYNHCKMWTNFQIHSDI